jgi:hypothetical protein
MSDSERLDIVEEKLAELLRKQDIAEAQMQRMVMHIAEMEAKLQQLHARQERWLTLLGLTVQEADQHLDLWQYPDLLRQTADRRQN